MKNELDPKSNEAMKEMIIAILKHRKYRVRRDHPEGRMFWGAPRTIDVLAQKPGCTLGVESRCQVSSGTAQEKLVSTLRDMESWPPPIRPLLVYHGPGYSAAFRAWLEAQPNAVELNRLADRLEMIDNG